MCPEVVLYLMNDVIVLYFNSLRYLLLKKCLLFRERKRSITSSCKTPFSFDPPLPRFSPSLYIVCMASSLSKPKPSWRTHSWNPFTSKKSQEQDQPDNVEEPSPTLPINAVYYPNWKVYKGLPPSSLNLRYVTHVFYAFAWCVSSSHLSVHN